MNQIIQWVILSLFASAVNAAGDGSHHGSITDLLWPFFNFLVLVSFLFWKLKNPISNAFSKKSKEIKDLLKHAQDKDREATERLVKYENKLKNLDVLKENSKKENQIELENFRTILKDKNIAHIEKFKADAEAKLENEKKKAVLSLNSTLLDGIIKKTKEKINTDSSKQKKANHNLISGLS